MRQENHTGSIVVTVILTILVAACAVLLLKVRVQAQPSVTPIAYEEPAALTDMDTPEPEVTYDAAELTGSAPDFTLSNTRVSAQTTEETNQPDTTQENNTEENTTPASTSSYICDFSSSRQMTEADVNAIAAQGAAYPGGRTAVQMIINEMYARYGYQFADAQLQAYFDQQSWYQALGSYTTDMSSIYNRMSAVEQANINYLSTF